MRFLLTKELGRLVKWLRILGYDAEYFTDNNTSSLIIQALRDNRIILTRNHHLPKPQGVKIVHIQAQNLKEQIAEVLKEMKIQPDESMMFSRCIICNVQLQNIDKEKIKDKVPEYVFRTQKDFITCPKCERIYWQGTHWGNVTKMLEDINS